MNTIANFLRASSRVSFALLLAVVGMLSAANSVASRANANPLDLPGWDLIWNDEFNADSPNTSEWELLTRRDSFNGELQYYIPEQITHRDGNLVITATDEELDQKPYRSGRMESYQAFGFGRFEARMQLTSGQGFWPAFWLFPNDPSIPWPTGGEIDILENRGSQPHLVSSAYHYNTVPNSSIFVYDEYSATNPDGSPVNFHTSFHDYAVEWEPDEIRFYVDGFNHYTISSDQVINFDTPKNIILNLAVGGFFGGEPDASTSFPSELLVDYVRVWERPEGYEPPPEPVDPSILLNGDFEASSDSPTDWNIFGSNGNNISINRNLTENGANALKLFGQFTGAANQSGVYQGVEITEGEALTAEAFFRTPSFDTLVGKTNEVTMSIEFYSAFGADRNSGNFLEEIVEIVIDGNSQENVWINNAIEAVAPAGAVEARLAFRFNQPNFDNGAVWIDSASLLITPVGLAGDFNDDGIVDAADFTIWRDNLGATTEDVLNGNGDGQNGVDSADYDLWVANFGETLNEESSSATVPEPSSVGILLLAILSLLCLTRQRIHYPLAR